MLVDQLNKKNTINFLTKQQEKRQKEKNHKFHNHFRKLLCRSDDEDDLEY